MADPVMLLFMLCCVPVLVHGFPNGPPESACDNMRPGTQVGSLGLEGHVTMPQNQNPTFGNTKEPPFFIEIYPHDTEWEAGKTYSVNVVANQTLGDNYFMGVILQARTVECSYNQTVRVEDSRRGRFRLFSSDTLLKLMECGEVTDGAVSHKTRQWKINETVSWTAPDSKDEGYGDIVFRATIVKTATVYWTEVNSAILRRNAGVAPPTCGATRGHYGAFFITSTLLLSLFTWTN